MIGAQHIRHIRRKHAFIASALIILFIATANAGGIPKMAKPNSIGYSDTTIQKDSLNNEQDLKLGFKDLFNTSTLSNGVSSNQLNPRAISFVQDYIDKYGKSMQN